MRLSSPFHLLVAVASATLLTTLSLSALAAEPTPTPTATPTPAPPHVGSGELLVTAPRLEVSLAENPAATTVVGEDTLSVMPRAVAAEEALALVPGVKVDNQANGERVHLSIRGQGILTERGIRGIKILLDGLPLNDPTGFAPDLFDVDWATVNRIEVLRGPASALYGGGANGGIIAIQTRNGANGPVGGEGLVTLGSNGFWKVLGEASGSGDGHDWRVSASRTAGDGYRVHTAFSATNLYGKFHVLSSDDLSLTVITAGTKFFNENAEGLNIDQVHEDPTQPNPDAEVFNEYQRTQRGTLGLVGRVALTADQELAFAAWYRQTLWKESVPSSVQHRTYGTPGAYLQYALHTPVGGLDNHFSLGADLDWQTIDETKRPNLGGAVEGAEVLSDQLIHQKGTAVYLLDRLELGEGWSLTFGARHDSIDNALDDRLVTDPVDLSGSADFSKTTARIGVAWSVSDDLGLYASWGQGFLPPATEELANNPAELGGFNQGLVPATSNGFEVGARGVAVTSLWYDVTVFQLSTENDFGRYRTPDRPLETFYRNAGSSSRWGLEAALTWVPFDALVARLSYTYSDFTYDTVEVGSDVYHGTKLPNSPDHMIGLDLAYTLMPRLTLGATVSTLTRAYIDPTNATWIGGYTLVDARVGWGFALSACTGELLVSGRNLTDKTYIAFTEPDPDGNSYQPGTGREFFAGVSLHF